jgi:long-subunit acyl-CoA synthetase (AMP-forming)
VPQEWVIVDHACAKYSLVSVPLETYGQDCFTKLLQNSAATVIFASRSWMTEVFDNYAAGNCQVLRFVVQIERLEYEEQMRAKKLGLPIYDFAFVEKNGERNRQPLEPPHTDDVCTIAYRWHTNNCEPIGWQVTHGTLAANANALGAMFKFSPKERHFSYVPMSHVGERAVLCLCLQSGARVGIFDSSTSPLIYVDIRKLRPTFLLSTPQGFSVPYKNAEAALRRSPFRFWATILALRCKARVGRRPRPNRCQRGLTSLLDALVFSKFIAQVGGSVKRIFVLSDATLNYMDHHLERQTQLILNCPVYKALVMPEIGGVLAVSQTDGLLGPGQVDGGTGALLHGGVLHPDLEARLEPLSLDLAGGGMAGELILKGTSLSVAAKEYAPEVSHDGGQDEQPAANGGLAKRDSVTFDRLNWVHSGIICEDLGGRPLAPGSWNVTFGAGTATQMVLLPARGGSVAHLHPAPFVIKHSSAPGCRKVRI